MNTFEMGCKTLFLSMILFSMQSGLSGQLIQNGSFEGPLIFQQIPPHWYNCGRFSTPDIQPGFWDQYTPPSSGRSYLQMVVRTDGTNEGVTQTLDQALLKDSTYFFAFDLMGIDQCRLFLWGGPDSCVKNELLWKSPPVENTAWQTYIGSFVPGVNYPAISLETYYSYNDSFYFAKVAIDDWRGFHLGDPPKQIFRLDTTLCEGDTLSLDYTFRDAVYEWQDGSSDPRYQITESGLYHIKLRWGRIQYVDTFSVSFETTPALQLAEDTSLCLDEILAIGMDVGNGQYLWQDGSTEVLIEVNQAGTYKVVYTPDSGFCAVSDSISVDFIDCEHYIEMPNVFSPNGDGINDLFHSIDAKGVINPHWKVFDRWGRLCFESQDLLNTWDGLAFGQAAAEGVYYWVVQYQSPRSETIVANGNLLLVR